MTKTCRSFVVARCPSQNLRQLMRDLDGPLEPWFPEEAYHPHLLDRMQSAHHRVELEGLRAKVQRAYQSLPGCPTWYRVTLGDLLTFQRCPSLRLSTKNKRTPLSLPRYRSWASEQEFNNWKSDLPHFRSTVFGLKGTLKPDSDQWNELADSNGFSTISLTLSSELGPKDPLAFLLRPLIKNRTQMLWIVRHRGDPELEAWWFNGFKREELPSLTETCEIQQTTLLDRLDTQIDPDVVRKNLINIGIPEDLTDAIYPSLCF
jgi:hypothetical protein